MAAIVRSVSRSPDHSFSKTPCPQVQLVAGHGIDGDAHAGATVQHRSRVARDASQPNLRQVHLVPAELFDRLADLGFRVGPGDIGENVTTEGVDLHGLPRGTVLSLGNAARVEVTGLRNPCYQLDGLAPGLMAAVLPRGADGRVVRTAGVMGVVLEGGWVRPGDTIEVSLPADPHQPLERV